MTCTWPIDRSCLPELPAEGTTEAEKAEYAAAVKIRNASENIAIRTLHALSGRQFGVCEAIARPCPRSEGHRWVGHPYDQSVDPYTPVYDSGRWINMPCGCGARRGCDVVSASAVHLPGPVASVTSVTIENTDLPSNVWVLEGDKLYRRDGKWPAQDMSKPLGSPGTWYVTYGRGVPVPMEAQILAARLASEMYLACRGNKCKLPRTVVSTTRSGVTHSFDPSRMLMLGFTGLPEVDQWIQDVNPGHLQAAPRVR